MPTPKAAEAQRTPRRTVIGTVVSDKMAKTITVRVSRKVREPEYGKYVTRHVTYKAHDEREQAGAGDKVEIAFARRLSKSKHWSLVRIVSAARVVAVRGEEELASLPGKQAPPAQAPAEGAAKEVPS
jgi:small subunit ribosomal protein S17